MQLHNILLVDDQEIPAQESIRSLEHFVPRECIHYVSSAAEAMDYLRERGADLVFLDIDMPGTSGFSLAEYMTMHHKEVPYVFLTGYANFAAKSYDYEPVDFLTKPIDLVRLRKTFERLDKTETKPESGRIALHTKQGYMLIDPRNILHISKVRRKVQLVCKDGRQLTVNNALEELEVILSDWGFFRCHQSYLIRLEDIQEIVPNSFGQTYDAVLANGVTVPISRSKTQALREALQNQGVRFL